ncbi:MAG: endopeptidase La [Desulfovibrionaceae bacterium]
MIGTWDFTDAQNDKGLLLPLMSLREVVMFPKTIVPLYVGREASIQAIEGACEKYEKKVFLVTQKDSSIEKLEEENLYSIGTVANILQTLRMPDGTIKVLFEGLQRAKWTKLTVETKNGLEFSMSMVTLLEDYEISEEKSQALVHITHDAIEEYSKQNKKLSPDYQFCKLTSIVHPGQLADAIMPNIRLEHTKKQVILETLDPLKRLEKVYELLSSEISVTSMEKSIKRRVKHQMEKNQREYYLNEQIKAIQKEMGKDDDLHSELDELEKLIKTKKLSLEAKEKAEKELKRLRQMSSSSAEYTVIRNYLDWILDLPWQEYKEIGIDLKKAESLLNAKHYGLEKTKERILEFLAVQKLVNKLKGPILCFVGPPGVGKTSLARSVAEATGREFVRIALGGVRDESEIRGHRRTYVGALPGKIIQSLKKVNSNNPLICLDEIDKMSTDFRGDPSAALLEVLDPEQNMAFNDHYLDLDYDLSDVFFVTTANSLHTIPHPLRDRMEIIQLSGYLENEKKCIIRDFILPRQREMHGITQENVKISDNAITEIIRSYTKEAGVRNLEREIATICRKVAMEIVSSGDTSKMVHITMHNISTYLGVKKYRYGEKEEQPQIGVCTGLAYTELGGELLVVETALMHGTGRVEITGKLGEVMTESAKAALSYVRSRSETFDLRKDFHKDLDIHIHVPEGATPKDGPSAGVTLTTALVSALLGIPVRDDIAMTGEISLRGRVLPIGGLREKLFAAQRGNIKTVFIPKDNEKDLVDIPQDLLSEIVVIPIEHIDELLPQALLTTGKDIFSGRSSTQPLHTVIRKKKGRGENSSVISRQ